MDNLKKNTKVINGDPLTFESKECHIGIHWFDRIFNDQVEGYRNWGQENEHANERKGWKEYLEYIEGYEQDVKLQVRWWEYAGKACQPGKPAPLIICLTEYINQCWQYIADEQGLYILAFEYHRNMAPPEQGLGAKGFGPRDAEIKGYKCVVDMMMEKYPIDPRRVYINGLSYGDMSAMTFARDYPDLLAGIVLIDGPTSPFNIREYRFDKELPALPVLMLRGDADMTCDGFPDKISFDIKGNTEWMRTIRSKISVINRDVWLRENKADLHPIISSDKKRFFLTYQGEKCDVILNEANRRSHVPAIDYAQVMWDNLYNVYQRGEDGTFEKLREPRLQPDRNAIALCVGKDKAYIDHKVTALPHPCYIVEPYAERLMHHVFYGGAETEYESFYAPVELLKIGLGIDYVVEDVENFSVWMDPPVTDRVVLDDSIIRFRWNGKEYALYTNTCLVQVDGHNEDLERPPLVLDGALMIPAAEVAKLLGLYCSVRNDVAYITDHEMELGLTVTRLIREEILGDPVLPKTYSVCAVAADHGSFALSESGVIAEGETLKVTVQPDAGYKVAAVLGRMSGLEAPINPIEIDREYWICNVLGDMEVEVLFEACE